MLRSRFLRTATTKFEEQYASTGSNMKGGKGREKTSMQISMQRSKPGALVSVLEPLVSRNLNILNISNRRAAYNEVGDYTTVFLDVEAHVENPTFKDALVDMQARSKYLSITGSWKIPWFPTEIAHLDLLDQNTLAAGSDLMDDPQNPHPGFHDVGYRERRKSITAQAKAYRHGQQIPEVEYVDEENAAWSVVWDRLTSLYPTHACKQFNYLFPRLVEAGGFSREKIPQLQKVSDFLTDATGFSIRPVAGLLSSRDFFNALAFRVFFSTQYIRHHSKPLYTPEPDVIHELMGHAPLLADPDFASLSQAIGMASLGASDADIEKLSRCYWYTIEFGLCLQGIAPKVMGAGLLSSFGELEYSLSGQPQLLDWDPFDAAKRPFPITTYQPVYYVAKDFKDAGDKFLKFAKSLEPPFNLEYIASSRKISVFPRDTKSILCDP